MRDGSSSPKKAGFGKESLLQAVSFKCPLNRQLLRQAECQQICSAPHNNIQKCGAHKCASPFRFCPACLLQGLGTKSDVIDDPAIGLCAFHAKNGKSAKREQAVRGPLLDSFGARKRLVERQEEKERARKQRRRRKSTTGERLVVQRAPEPATTQTDADVAKVLPFREIELGREIEVDTSLVVPLKNQPRSYFNRALMAGLKASIKSAGQLQVVPAIRLPDGRFQISDGERRWRVCKELKRPLRILVIPAVGSPDEEIERSAISNFNRQEHPAFEKARIFHALRYGPLQRSVSQIAEKFGVHITTVTTYTSIFERLDPRIIQLMDPVHQGGVKRALKVAVGIELTRLDSLPEEQFRLAQQIVKRRLGMQGAKRLINERMVELGIGGRKTRGRARDHFKSVEHIVERLEMLLMNLHAEGDDRWREVLAQRTGEAKARLKARLRKAHGVLTKLMEGLLEDEASAKK